MNKNREIELRYDAKVFDVADCEPAAFTLSYNVTVPHASKRVEVAKHPVAVYTKGAEVSSGSLKNSAGKNIKLIGGALA